MWNLHERFLRTYAAIAMLGMTSMIGRMCRLVRCFGVLQDSLTGFGYTSVTKRMDIGGGGTGRDWSISFAIGLC